MDYAELITKATEVAAKAEEIEATKLSTGYSWSEIPRWHEGAFYFSDMYNHKILTLSDSGEASTFIDASDRKPVMPEPGSTAPGEKDVVLGGLGWLPDGRAVTVSMHERLLLVFDGENLDTHADLREVAISSCNDMVVDADGRCYITQLGYDLFGGETPQEAEVIIVEPDGSVRNAGVGTFKGANGITITGDGATVIVAENDGLLITALDRGADGALANRRVFAQTVWMPDGICLDDDGGVWAGLPGCGFVGRFVEGGELTHVVPIPMDQGFGTAVALGGEDRRTLYIAAGLEVFDWAKSREEGLGTIWTAQVPFGGGSARP